MQFLADRSFEHGEHPGLAWISGDVKRIDPDDPGLKVPHMGWNELHVANADSPIMREIAPGTAVYFVHSYHFVPNARECVVATTHHGADLVAAVQRDHVFGVQFHPEKSQGAGLAILKNFAHYALSHAQKAPDTVPARP
jgi:glutamine amidotransferase